MAQSLKNHYGNERLCPYCRSSLIEDRSPSGRPYHACVLQCHRDYLRRASTARKHWSRLQLRPWWQVSWANGIGLPRMALECLLVVETTPEFFPGHQDCLHTAQAYMEEWRAIREAEHQARYARWGDDRPPYIAKWFVP